MNPGSTRVPESSSGFLKSCLVEGDPAQQQAASKIRRRAIFLSVILQSLALMALVVFPLLTKGERLPVKIFVERPPYRLGTDHPGLGKPAGEQHSPPNPYSYFTSIEKPSRPRINYDGGPSEESQAEIPGLGDGPLGTRDGVPFGNDPSHSGPKPPADDGVPHTQQPPRVTIGHIDPARLTRRVEPRYPAMGIQLRRETRVELQAVISTDGSIQSLQVLSGDPLFYQSVIDAVRQWQYSPTVLNGRPVEIDTHITVIYSLNH
jgi:periplasmic protein TonB